MNRSSPRDLVKQVVEKFKQNPKFVLALSPEGTRSKKAYWKTGFYRIAKAADVPIQLAYIDKAKREVGLGPILHPSGNMEKDFDWLNEFYQHKQGLRPGLMSDIRVPSERPKSNHTQ